MRCFKPMIKNKIERILTPYFKILIIYFLIINMIILK